MSSDHEKSTAYLGDVADLTIGRTPPRNVPKYWTTDLALPFCSIADMRKSVIVPQREGITPSAEAAGVAKRVAAGTLLMSFKLSIGRVGFAGVDLFPNEAIVAVNPKTEKFSRAYIRYALEAADLNSMTSDAVKGKTLNLTSLRQIPIPIASLTGQRRIVELLAAADNYVASLSAQLVAQRSVLYTITETMVTELLASGRQATVADAATETPATRVETPSAYCLLSVKLYGAGVVATSKRPNDTKSGRPYFVRLPGEILIGRQNFHNGSAGMVPDVTGTYVTSNAISSLTPDLTVVLPEYLLFVLQSPTIYKQVDQFISGTGQKETSPKLLMSLKVPLPDLDTQATVVKTLSTARVVVAQAEQQLAAATAARKHLLHDLLSGSHIIPASYDLFLEGETA